MNLVTSGRTGVTHAVKRLTYDVELIVVVTRCGAWLRSKPKRSDGEVDDVTCLSCLKVLVGRDRERS